MKEQEAAQKAHRCAAPMQYIAHAAPCIPGSEHCTLTAMPCQDQTKSSLAGAEQQIVSLRAQALQMLRMLPSRLPAWMHACTG